MNAKSIFLDALELEADARAQFVAHSCGDDAGLAERVRALVEAHRRAEDEQGASGSWVPSGLPATPFALASAIEEDLAAGQTIGAYRLVEEIGDGGFGRVWLAEQERPVRRRVALKVLKAGLDTREVVQRFQAERQALALMDHACIARVFDGGATERGLPWFAMEYVDGPPITTYCRERRLGARERLALFLDACRAVQHAHQKGVIHRDIKPNNVLVGEVDGQPIVKVIDFGIAKAIEQSLTEDTLKTRGDQLIGTPAYMSPEQVERSVDVDTRADVYSLGVLLYELLAGATPFADQTRGTSNPAAVMQAVRELEPVRPSARLQRLEVERGQAEPRPPIRARELKGELDWIALRCLEKDRERRFASAAALADDLERHLAGDTVLAGPPAMSYRLSKLARRYRGALVFAAVVFLTLIGGVVAATGQASRARAAEKLSGEETARALEAEATALAETERARRELDKYEGIAGLLEHVLMSIDPADARDMDTELLLDILERAHRDVERGEPQPPEVEAAVRRVIGGAYLSLARYPESQAQLERAFALREQTLGPDAPETLESMEELGGLFHLRGELDRAEELLARSHAGRARVLGPEHELTIHTLVNLATTHMHQGRLEEAEAELRELEAWHLEHYGALHADTLLVMNNLAMALDRLGHREEALERYRLLLASQTELEGPDSPRTLSALNNLGALLTNLGHADEALPLLERALEAKRRVLPAGHPSLLIASSSLARAHAEAGDPERAEAIYDAALAEGREALGEEERHVLILAFNRAQLLMRAGRFDEVLAELEQLVPVIERTEPEGSQLLEAARSALAKCRGQAE